jgi:hypothetical protein
MLWTKMVHDRAQWRALLLDLANIHTPQRKSAEYKANYFRTGYVTAP